MSKIEIRRILSEHLSTLKDPETERIEHVDKWLFFWIPLLLGVCSPLLNIRPTNSFLDILSTSLSVFAGLLFSLLVMLLSQSQKDVKTTSLSRAETLGELIHDLYINVSFAILLSLVALTTVILRSLMLPPDGDTKPVSIYALMVGGLLDGAMFALVACFLVTMLMILKRTFVIFSDDLSSRKKQ